MGDSDIWKICAAIWVPDGLVGKVLRIGAALSGMFASVQKG